MTETVLRGIDASDPLAFLAALGVLRVVSRTDPGVRLRWERRGPWRAVLEASDDLDLIALIETDLDRWRSGHPALEFAVNGNRKVQDLKHPPEAFRELMRRVAGHPEAAEFIAAYATGVAVDGSGQTKPTSLHFTAGQQRFLDAVLDVRDVVTRGDFEEALFGPWNGRVGPKDTRWRAGSQRSRALLSFDPSKEKSRTVAGAVWLGYQAMPYFPCVPRGERVITTGFRGRGKREIFVWPVWSCGLSEDEVRVLVGMRDLFEASPEEREARGISGVFRAAVTRNSQGYGSFAAAQPV